MDIVSKQIRSAMMAKIRSRGNRTTELALVGLFRASRITGWRRGAKLPGRPDLVFPKAKVAVFVDGCFWHGCHRHFSAPTSNAAFWKAKIAGNRARDKRVSALLRKAGWRVIRVWEHQLRSELGKSRISLRVHDAIARNQMNSELRIRPRSRKS